MPEKIPYGAMDAPVFNDNNVSVIIPNFDKLNWRPDSKGRNSTARAEIKFATGNELVTPTGEHITKAQFVLVKTDEQYLAEKKQAAVNRTWREFATAFKDLTLGQMEEFFNGELRLKLVNGSVAVGSDKKPKKVLREIKDGSDGVGYLDLPSIYSQPPEKQTDSQGKPILWTKEKVDAMIEKKQGGTSGVSRDGILKRIDMLKSLVEKEKGDAKDVWLQVLAEANASLKKHDQMAAMRAKAKATKANGKVEDKGDIPFPSTSQIEQRRAELKVTPEAAALA
jgi:hypothetical protein